VDKAEESLDLVKKQYEGGSATVTRYLEAELDSNQARIRAIAARYDREKARAEIGRAIGHWQNQSQPE
jgi:outer membrane protein TolC